MNKLTKKLSDKAFDVVMVSVYKHHGLADVVCDMYNRYANHENEFSLNKKWAKHMTELHYLTCPDMKES
jgi:hypothetical protein